MRHLQNDVMKQTRSFIQSTNILLVGLLWTHCFSQEISGGICWVPSPGETAVENTQRDSAIMELIFSESDREQKYKYELA